MACKGKCLTPGLLTCEVRKGCRITLNDEKKTITSAYLLGFKYCKRCGLYLKSSGSFCECCGWQMRSKPIITMRYKNMKGYWYKQRESKRI